MDFLIYELTTNAVYLGERAKGNLFKPCLRTVPFSAISGAVRRRFGQPQHEGIKAVGFLEESVGRNRAELLTYSPRDRVVAVSKIPLQAEFLSDVLATVVILDNSFARQLPDSFAVVLGGMRSCGFGAAQLRLKEKRPAGSPRPGLLRMRLPEEEAISFGIVKVQMPIYGYLFKPEPATAHDGMYVRALFEGSRVVGPEILLRSKKRQTDGQG